MLLSVFRQNFVEASHARDSSATSRFFKLFPAIGWEAEGLDAYATFVVELVRARSPPTAKSNSGSICVKLMLLTSIPQPHPHSII